MGALIDIVVLVPVFIAFAMTMGTTTGGNLSLSGPPALLFTGVALLYFILAEGLTGKTVGKKLTNMKLVGKDGEPATWGQVIGRNLLRIVDGLFFYLVGFLVMLFADDNRRLGDILSDTIVIEGT